MLLFNICLLVAAVILAVLVSHTVEGSSQDEDIPLRNKADMAQGAAYGDIHKPFFNDGHWKGEVHLGFR